MHRNISSSKALNLISSHIAEIEVLNILVHLGSSLIRVGLEWCLVLVCGDTIEGFEFLNRFGVDL